MVKDKPPTGWNQQASKNTDNEVLIREIRALSWNFLKSVLHSAGFDHWWETVTFVYTILWQIGIFVTVIFALPNFYVVIV